MAPLIAPDAFARVSPPDVDVIGDRQHLAALLVEIRDPAAG
jgi:hypothetical protein